VLNLRKNQSQLTAAERKAFVDAVLAMKHRPSRLHADAADRSRYDDFVEVHMNAMMVMMMDPPAPSWGHQAAAFGPWHRVLLMEFERELQVNDPAVTIPYWDWTHDSSPTASLWTHDFLGPDGAAGTGRVGDGPFAGGTNQWPIRIKDDDSAPDYLTRRMGAQADARTLPTGAAQMQILARTPYDTTPWEDTLRDQNDAAQWDGFRLMLEIALHNPVHRWVGGNMQDMASPNDPVFWLHHCNCDRLWAAWQLQHVGTAAYLPDSGGPVGHNLTDTMIFHEPGGLAPWDRSYRPADVVDHRALNIKYDTDPAVAPPIVAAGPEPSRSSAQMGQMGSVGSTGQPHLERHELPMFVLASEIPALNAMR
jgi:tyrosinase